MAGRPLLVIPKDIDITFGEDAVILVKDPKPSRYGAGLNCRSGCKTMDHMSYSECCKGLQINAQGLSGTRAQKELDSSLEAYRRARKEGIQPDGTSMAQVEKAKKMSDTSGVAYGVVNG